VITVTGATGMTGRHVIAGLLDAGLPVRAMAHSPASADRLPGRLRYALDQAVGLIPLGRPAAVDDVAAAVAYLAREDAGFVTGQVVSVNGGSSMG
jgi:uncharacterized protein YbjT (DUF2867 family)